MQTHFTFPMSGTKEDLVAALVAEMARRHEITRQRQVKETRMKQSAVLAAHASTYVEVIDFLNAIKFE